MIKSALFSNVPRSLDRQSTSLRNAPKRCPCGKGDEETETETETLDDKGKHAQKCYIGCDRAKLHDAGLPNHTQCLLLSWTQLGRWSSRRLRERT